MLRFNLINYELLLAAALNAGYQFIGFQHVNKSGGGDREAISPGETFGGGKILLRHDVDADMAAAVVMARLEAQLGIQSTFFLMWRSPCYNLMSRAGQNLAEKIVGFGHHIGLHYDQGFDSIHGYDHESTASHISKQVECLESLLSCQVHAVSFHQPSQALLQAGMDCGNKINTYDKSHLSDYRYISDSNRVFPLWPSPSLVDDPNNKNYFQADSDPGMALADCFPQNIQLLIHPMWWVYEDESCDAVWNKAIKSNIDQMQDQLVATERVFGKRRKISIY